MLLIKYYKMKKLLALLALCVLFMPNVFAQDVEMADGLYSSGKIYVVVACLAVIMLGLFIYLFSMDRRLKKIEKNSQDLK